jgi:hypothetical protein
MVPNKQLLRIFIPGILSLAVTWAGCTTSPAVGKDAPRKIDSATPSATTAQAVGRYQLVPASGGPGSLFLIDTGTGCVWHLVQNEKTKRPTFIEADVENLHWGWGSGAQQILAAQIESLSYPEEHKRTLKQTLQKTECGQFNVTLAPDASRKAEPVPEAKPKDSEK